MTATHQRQKGIVLPLVLWGIVIMTVLAVTIARSTRARIAEITLQTQYLEASVAAESAIYEAIARMAFGNLPVLVHRPELSVEVDVADETGKVDLNVTEPNDLARALSPVLGQSTAEQLAARIADWRDPDDVVRPFGAERATYQAAGAALLPRNREFLHVDELYQVIGVTPDVAARILPLLTVQSRRAQWDLAVAPRPLREANGEPDVSLDHSRAYPLGRPYMITAIARRGDVRAAVAATVILTGRAENPFRTLTWEWLN